MLTQNINKIFENMNRRNVLIIGDVIVDNYLWAKVERISPEAPVPIVTVQQKENRLGGAANVALNVQAMGATPILCSVIGNDFNGTLFTDLMGFQGLTSEGIIKSNQRQTTVKTRVISSNHHLLRVDDEIVSEITESETRQLSAKIKQLLSKEKIDVLIFEDYDKGVLNKNLIQTIIAEANKHNIPIAVDPKRKNFWEYKNVNLFKPNLKELREGLNIDLDHRNKKTMQKNLDDFQQKQNINLLLVTLSEMGIYVSNKKVKEFIPAHIRNIADVSGAGDTVISVAALGLALNLPPVVLATIANLAGGLVCEKAGVVPIDKKLLLQKVCEIKF